MVIPTWKGVQVALNITYIIYIFHRESQLKYNSIRNTIATLDQGSCAILSKKKEVSQKSKLHHSGFGGIDGIIPSLNEPCSFIY